MLLQVAASLFFQVFATLAFTKEKAVRVAPIGSFVLVLNCLFDYAFFGTQLRSNQLIGGLLIFCTNLIMSLLKCQNIIK